MSKTVLITGAYTGIGRATALKFQAEGWNVIATMRNPGKEEELYKLENVLVTKLDVLDLDSIDAAVKAGIEKFEKIDALVNNAGYGAYGPLEAFPRENIIRQFNTNVIGLLDVSRALLKHFRVNKSGIIVNISSIGGRVTFPLGSLYHGTKFAVEGISEAMVYEAQAIGVKIKIVEPGTIQTDFAGRSFDFTNDESMEEYQNVVNALWAGFGNALEEASPASLCADVIYTSVTDGTDQLRYAAGPDAEEMLPARIAMSDSDWIGGIKQRFSL